MNNFHRAGRSPVPSVSVTPRLCGATSPHSALVGAPIRRYPPLRALKQHTPLRIWIPHSAFRTPNSEFLTPHLGGLLFKFKRTPSQSDPIRPEIFKYLRLFASI